MARDTWYRLDNVGKFYSSQAGDSSQTVFRFSATVADEVDALILQEAVEHTVSVFPNLNVCLRSGFFWHYLEQSPKPPKVQEENLPICFGLHVGVKSTLFRVSYYKSRINFEMSHIVSDGRGALSIFKVLLYSYLQKRYDVENIPQDYDGSELQKSENSFDRYYERAKTSILSGGKENKPPRKQKVYKLSGWHDEADPTYIEYHVPTKDIRTLAKSYGVSVTSLIITALLLAIQKEMPHRLRNREIRISIPVDLRQIFESATTKNFFGLAFVSCSVSSNESTQALAQRVHEQLKKATEPENLKPRMNRMISLEKNPLLRYAPLFMKDFALDIADRFAKRTITTTVSNLGKISINEQLEPYVKDINILSSTTSTTLTMCSFGEDMSIGLSSVLSSMETIKHFCRFFSAEGIKGTININKTGEEGLTSEAL